MNMNPLATYAEAGAKAGLARKRKDEATAQFHSGWMRKALTLEAEPYRSEARKAFDDAYSEAATPPPMRLA